ncbi:olfactory receptor 5F1-like [Alligator mississippiensis]|uniref:olfactory receptor 5F1-like n=1 Tax=Alligator mississippiensis TaxID=8496 RepID=UPI0003D0ECB9|nr:olfactory receptor 5F1-like [Alligator mississippiensis]
MAGENLTMVSEFILLGFSNHPGLQVAIFMLFLLIYVITLVGNLGMIILIRIDSQLHTPMYFFLSHLSFIDFCHSSNTIPKALSNVLLGRKAIPYIGCIVQLYLFIALITSECFLLAMMAYDRYVAICNPLLYTVVMSQKHCLRMTAVMYAAGFFNSVIHTTLTHRLNFCQSNVIDHFFCELPSLLKLSCSETHTSKMLMLMSAGFNISGSILIILSSYTYILFTILKIHSTAGRHKAFSTCVSHLTVVTIFYGTAVFTHLQPHSEYSQNQDKVASVFYTVVTPMLNPVIYSLRNKEVKDALKRVMSRKMFSHFL